MTFVCAQCRYRVLAGFEPWENCIVCSKVRTVLKDVPPYVPDYRLLWRTPKVRELPPPSLQPAVGEERPYSKSPGNSYVGDQYTFGRQEWEYEGEGDPQLAFECFNDFTYSPEYRTQMREQLNIEFDLMPEDDMIPHIEFWFGGRTRKSRVKYNH